MKSTLGWTGVAICTLISSLWAFWGAIEGFHEGWWHKNLATNVLMAGAYLLPAVLIAGLGIASVLYPRVGMALCTTIAVFIAAWALKGNFHITSRNWLLLVFFTVLPIAFGLLFLFGTPIPKRVALWMIVGIPAAIALVCGTPMAWRVAHRIDDGNRGPRAIEGNGVRLEWAGAGPGWDRKGGASLEEARHRCEYLSADGKTLESKPQRIWRLPTVGELVASLSLHGKNSGGRWDAKTHRAAYKTAPDKESPLWDTKSQVTYYWTDTEADANHAYWVVYHGGVYAKLKSHAPGNVGFRAVREVR